MPILGMIASGVVLPPSYSLAETINATQNWTVPAGVAKIAVYAWGGGAGGRTAGNFGASYNPDNGNLGSNAGAGGSGGGGVAFKDFSVNAGTSYTVTIGAGGNSDSAGSATTFGNLLSAGAGNSTAFGGNVSASNSNVSGFVTVNTGKANNVGIYNNAASNNGPNGNPGDAATALTLTGTGLVSYTHGGGGGGGGSGGVRITNAGTNNGGTGANGGANTGGNGGNGGNATITSPGVRSVNAGTAGNSATAPAGGGGGGGAGGLAWEDTNVRTNGAGGAAGIGAAGRVYIYTSAN